MTISTTTAFKRTLGNGVTTAFSFPYHFFENGDLVVYLETNADGTAVLQVLDTHYTVADADDPDGGTVNFLSAPASTKTVVIIRKPDLEQSASFTSFSATVANDALDRIYELLQLAALERSRSIRLAETQAPASLELPHYTDRADMALGFDENGDLELTARAVDLLAENTADLAAIEAAAASAILAASNASGSAVDAAASAVLAAADAAAADIARIAAQAAETGAADYETDAAAAAVSASGSASSASTSASTATTQASTATTKAGEAAASAASAVNARNNAEGFATDAAASAVAAAASELAAASSETAAELAETNAETAETGAVAARAAAEAARDVAIASSENPAPTYAFDSSTADADPGAGEFRLNHATPASVTAVYLDNADADGNALAGWLDSFDNSSNTTKGVLVIKGIDTPTAFLVGHVTGSVVDGTGYRKVTVTVLASGGTFTATERFSVLFAPTGDAGADGGGLASVVEDTSPQLGGNLDLNGFVITGMVIGTNLQAWDAQLDSLSSASANGVSLATSANYAAMRGLLDLEAGTDFYSIAAADAAFQPINTNLTEWATLNPSANAGSLVTAADYAAMRVLLALTIGTNVQAYDADLTTWAGLTPSANAQSLVTSANYASMRGLLDLEAGTDFYSIAAADTAFLSPSEGNAAYAAIGQQIISGGGLTGGGTLAADRTLVVGAGTGIAVNADDVAVDKASDANVHAAASNKVITSDLIESAAAYVTLTDAATIAVDWDTFVNGTVTLTANRALGNPSNGQPGTNRMIYVIGNDATDRTITFGANFLGEVPTITDADSGRAYLLTIHCKTTSHFVVSSKKALG